MNRVISDLHRLQTSAQNQVGRMNNNMVRKQARISELLQESFAFRLLYQQNAHHLQQCRGNIGLLEYNRDRLYERYENGRLKK